MTLLSLSMGDWLPFPKYVRWGGVGLVIPALSQSIGGLFFTVGVFLMMFNREITPLNSYNYEIGSIIVIGAFILYTCFFSLYLIPWRKKNGEYILAWKLLTEHLEIFGLHTVGPTPPAYLNLSDGGHFDNLGLVQLLKRQVQFIIVIDAAMDPKTTCEDLLYVINLFRPFGYSFKAQNLDPKRSKF